jgi:hypothetical protein
MIVLLSLSFYNSIMIIDDIKYVQMSADISCSMSACLSMLLAYYGVKDEPNNIADLFSNVYMSNEFKQWAREKDKFMDGSTMLICACYILNKYYKWIDASIVETDITKIKLSYIRRKIPVIISGSFPLTSGKVSNSILLRGYVDDYFIVNDPRGNALAGYVDKFGEKTLYKEKQLEEWTVSNGHAEILRVIDRTPIPG